MLKFSAPCFVLLLMVWGNVTLKAQDAPVRQEGTSEGVTFSASDSLVFTLGKKRIARLYGNAKVIHTSGELSAGTVSLNITDTEMEARSRADADTLERPLLLRDGEELRSNSIRYNYTSGKGKFEYARVSISEGNLIGDQVKRALEHVIYVQDGKYSTCQLDHPHFYIQARKMKVVDEEEIFFTRAKLYILDIPYPLVFPFGYVPARPPTKKSGILAPTFQNQNIATRGYGLTNLGWFQYFNDNVTGTLSTGIFTSGTVSADGRLQYKVTDKFDGNITLGYSREQGLEPTDPSFNRRTNKSLLVTHRQTINPFSSISADLNFRTADYYQRNSTSIDDRAEITTNSKIAYNYSHPEGLFSFNTNAQQTQNFQTNAVQLSGPSANFSLKRLTPFQRKGKKSSGKWYESLAIGYSNNFRSDYRFQPLAGDSASVNWFEALLDRDIYEEATGNENYINFGLGHRANMSSQLLSSNFVQLTGNLNFNEYWYPQTIERVFDEENNTVETQRVPGFAAARDYSASMNFTTTLFGISNKSIGNLEGFRHTFRPTMSFSYSPDFSDPSFGYFETVQSDTLGNTQTYSRFQGSIIGGPSQGEQRALNLSISNVFETKQVKRDSTGEKTAKVIRIIDNLSLSTGYNFAAERFKLRDLQTSMVSNMAKKIRINANAGFTFYDTDSLGARVDRYLWEESNSYARLTNFTFNASTSFSEGKMGGTNMLVPFYPRRYDPLNQTYFESVDPNFFYEPVPWFDVPWSFSLSFRYSWNRTNPNNLVRQAQINAQNISLRLTPEWQIGTALGYDFIQKELTPTRFRFNRNLHCWNMSMEWSPFGDFKFFMFSINVNSQQFGGLFQKLPGLNNLNRNSAQSPRGF